MKIKKGDEISVIAWWKGNSPCVCEVISVWRLHEGDYRLTVKPLEGNPHWRYVSPENVIVQNESLELEES